MIDRAPDTLAFVMVPEDADAVSVWCQVTDACGHDHVAAALRDLSADERVRANQFRFARDRRDYVLAHGLLRKLLATRYGPDSVSWPLAADSRGRPLLPGHPGVRLSLSHATGCVACAVADDHDVGVDVEPLARWPAIEGVADAVLAASERSWLARCTSPERSAALVDLWTLKEATAKAVGLGLAMPLSAASFQLAGASIAWEGSRDLADPGWTFAVFAPAEDYHVAVAVRPHTARAPRLTAWCWAPEGCRTLHAVRLSASLEGSA